MIKEIWKPITGFSGHYEVSNLGRVRSVDRLITKEGAIRGYPRVRRGQILKPGTAQGYLLVGLFPPGAIRQKQQTKYVHRLVAAAFLEKPLTGDDLEICHNDGNQLNNAVTNLRFATHRENEADKKLHGTFKTGQSHWSAKLSDSQVDEIRALRGKHLQRELAAAYGVSQALISTIWNDRHRACLMRWEGQGKPVLPKVDA